MDPKTINADTGEVLDTTPPAITMFIEQIRKGEFALEAGAAFSALVLACKNTQRTGTFSIKFTVKPDDPMVKLEATYAASTPKSDPSTAIFFPDDFGVLHRSDPRSQATGNTGPRRGSRTVRKRSRTLSRTWPVAARPVTLWSRPVSRCGHGRTRGSSTPQLIFDRTPSEIELEARLAIQAELKAALPEVPVYLGVSA